MSDPDHLMPGNIQQLARLWSSFHSSGCSKEWSVGNLVFGDGDLDRRIGAAALFKEAALEWSRATADLWNIEVELAEGGLESAGFETVGLPITGLAALAGSDLKVSGAFEDHGCVGEYFGDERDAFKDTVLKKGVDRFMGEGIVRVFGHDWGPVRL